MAETKKSSGLGGGLWVIIVVALIGATIFTVMGYKASHSGSTQQIPDVGTVVTEENVSFFATIGVLGIILYVAAIVIFLAMRSER